MGGWPTPLFNPYTDPSAVSPAAWLAGPAGLIAFAPAALLLWLLPRRLFATGLVVTSLAWLLLTLQPVATLVLLGWLGAAVAWLLLLTVLRRRALLSQNTMIAWVWIGLHALVAPFWWWAHPSWYPAPTAFLQSAGLAFFLLRLIAWGHALAHDPHQPLRPPATLCWLLYPPGMRLGPVLLRRDFLKRWPSALSRGPQWRAGLPRAGWFVAGAVAFTVIGKQLPAPRGGTDFFATPAAYSTAELLRVYYLIPLHIYFLIWTYSELASTLGYWLGIPVDDNFAAVPRATSVRDFWRRWHITLGTWLRDFLYIPLGGSRRHVALAYAGTFGYCAVWHGASWSFLAWGATQVVALLIQRAWDSWRGQRAGRASLTWLTVSWLLTLHYQLTTIIIFVDFDHAGGRFLSALAARLGA